MSDVVKSFKLNTLLDDDEDEVPLKNNRKPSAVTVKTALELGNIHTSGINMNSDLIKKFSQFSNYKTLPSKRIGSFWEFLSQYSAGGIEANPNVMRTHGTMGWTFMFSVPLKKEKELLDQYIIAVFFRDENICLAQSVTKPYFMFFIDYDYKSKHPIETFEYALAASSFVNRCYAKFFPELAKSDKIDYYSGTEDFCDPELAEWTGAGDGFGRLRSVVATSGVKKGKDKKGNDEWSLGIHQYWIGRNLVNTQQAITMAMYMQNELEKHTFTSSEGTETSFARDASTGHNAWSSVIDIAVYKGNGGARMLGSCKIGICGTCKGSGLVKPSKDDVPSWSREKEDLEFDKYYKSFIQKAKGNSIEDSTKCKECQGRKRVIQKKAYTPLLVLDGNGQIEPQMQWLVENPKQYIHACSIRTSRVEPDIEWVLPEGVALFDAETKITKDARSEKINGPVVEDDDLEECGIGSYLAPTSRIAQLVLSCIRGIDPHFADLGIQPIKRQSKTQYYAYLKPDYQNHYDRYCLNKKDVHENRVYFVIDPKNIYQKCHSNNIECHEWWKKPSAKKTPLEFQLRELLFGKTILPTSLQVRPPTFDPPVPKNFKDKPDLKKRSPENIAAITFIKHMINERIKYMPVNAGGIDYKEAWKDEMVKLAKYSISGTERQYQVLEAKKKKRKNNDDEDDDIEDDDEPLVPPPKPVVTDFELYAERTGRSDKIIADDEPIEVQHQRVFYDTNKKKKKPSTKKQKKPEPVQHGGINYSSTTFTSI